MPRFFPFFFPVFVFCPFFCAVISAQEYTYYPTGDTTDITVTDTEPILVLAGGGIDKDQTITDTHFDQRDRAGRTMAFLARLSARTEVDRPFAITANEATAVVIDQEGRVQVYGTFPAFDDFAYFLRVNCGVEDYLPETLLPGQPLTWDRNGQAVVVYRVPGTPTGENYFDITDWEAGNGGQWAFWSVLDGTLYREPGESISCIVPVLDPRATIGILRCYPNPVRGTFRLWDGSVRPIRLNVYRSTGQLYRRLAIDHTEWSTTDWPAGIYLVELIDAQGGRYVGKLVVLWGRLALNEIFIHSTS